MAHRILIFCLPWLLISQAMGWVELTQVRKVDYASHANIGNCYAACPRANGGILFCDGYEDGIIQVANPLVTDGVTADAANSYEVALASTFADGYSWQGITYDGVYYYASGASGSGCVLVRLQDPNNGSAYTSETLTVSPNGPYSGVAAVGSNNLIMANYNTGAVQFFTVSGTAAAANGAEIANTNAGSYKTTQVVYYSAGSQKRIFAYMVALNKTRRIDVFTTDGTPAGTAYAGTLCNGLDSTTGVDAARGQMHAAMTADGAKQVLAASVNVGASGTCGYDVFELRNSIPVDGSAAPSVQLRSTLFTGGTNRLTCGAAFFASGGQDYIAFTSANVMNAYSARIFTAAQDWSLY